MKDKVALVSGATDGIGKVTARALAEKGARVVIVGRNPEKTSAAARAVGAVGYLLADLSSIKQTQAAAAQFLNTYDRLDVLVNNAGSVFMARRETEDGFEATFGLNHLVGYFLFTNLVLDRLVATAAQTGEGRVVSVSSGAHMGGRIQWDDLMLAKGYQGFTAYSQSKLANVLFAVELARRLAGTGVTSNALHPGIVRTKFGRTNNERNPLMGAVMTLASPFAINEEQGARTSIYLASSPEVQGVTGKYWVREKAVTPSAAAQDAESARRLWAVSEQLLVEKGVRMAEKVG